MRIFVLGAGATGSLLATRFPKTPSPRLVAKLIRRRGMLASPISWATAHLAALFVKHLPRELAGVHPPEALPAKTRQTILADARASDIRLVKRIIRLKRPDDETYVE